MIEVLFLYQFEVIRSQVCKMELKISIYRIQKIHYNKIYNVDDLSLAKQLLDKENHKFQYKEIEHGGRAQKYYSSVEWLLRADMVQLCKLVILERGTNGWIISNRSTKLPTYRYRMHRYTGKS